MDYTHIRLTLGNLTFKTNDVQYLEITSSVFLFGETGKISVILNTYKDIYKLPMEGTLNLSDPQHTQQFWNSPLEFYVIGEYIIKQVDYRWIVTFEFANKHAIKMMQTYKTMSFSNKTIKDIISTIVQYSDDSVKLVTNDTITNKYNDKPLIWYNGISQLDMLKYLIPRQNPQNQDLLLFFIERNKIKIKTPDRKTISGIIDAIIGTQSGNLVVTDYTYKIKPNIPINVKLSSQLQALQFNDNSNDDYQKLQNQLYTNVLSEYSKIIVPPNLYSTSAISSTLFTGEEDSNILNSIITYMIDRLLFNYATFEFTTVSDNTRFFLDTQIQINFYDIVGSPKIDPIMSDTFYIMQLHRVIQPINNKNAPPNIINMKDVSTITSVQYPRIKQE